VRSANVALITQSIDSRNHVIVAASVTAGLVAALLHFALLDTIVGLAVAILILKSAVELAVEVWRSFGEEEPDLSRYRLGFLRRYERFRQTQLRDWMLYLLADGKVKGCEELIVRAQDALDFRDIAMLRALGMEVDPHADEMIQRSLAEMLARGWVQGEDRWVVTSAGAAHLRERRWGMRGESQGVFLAE
jgi:hypothetical protein